MPRLPRCTRLWSDCLRNPDLYRVLFSTSSNVSKYRMVNAGVGCALLPATFAVPLENVVYFRLTQHPHWEITICCRKNAYLSYAEKRFLELCQEYWVEKLDEKYQNTTKYAPPGNRRG
ncbi:MAG: LysR family transcriptional regulator substrate-binding protein [Lachnospiraceae bacterium]